MVFIYALLSSLFIAFSSGGDVPYSAIESAFSSGDAAKIVNAGKDKMLLNVLDKDGVYAQSQATQVLRDFFAKKPTNSFKFSFKGTTASGGANAIGTYSSKGENFRVTVKWAKVGAEYLIESIAIEKV